jgi:hypothetical protein
MPGRNARRAAWALGIVGAILLAVVLPPYINVNRYRGQVAASLGRALGRDVSVSNIELQMMPRPGLVMSQLVIADDPSYGAEPMLRCDSVTAYLRISSLWRGRLEIGTLALENPSLNLVRRDDGRWNVESLVERTSQVQSAPTAKPSPETRPRVPYVEATAGRINFKLGQVKKRFAFSDADFALWLESENEWGVRMEARPMRADLPAGETGLLRIEGQFQRASSLQETPLKLKVSYTKGQMGQVTALMFGKDRGWRGGVTGNATLAGTPRSLAVTADARVDDFRRYDIALGEALRLAVHCTGTYSSSDDSLRGLQCETPVKPGLVMLRGNVVGMKAQSFNLGVTAEDIPLERIVALARHTKKDLPEDLTATGSTQALFTVRRDQGATAVWPGGGRTTRFALHSKVLKQDLELGPLEFNIAEADTKRGAKRASIAKPAVAGQSTLQVVVKPFAIPLGATTPATAAGSFGLAEYKIGLRGDAELTRLTAIASAMGIATPNIGVAGPAQVDFAIAGAWTGFARPRPLGKLQIHNATVELQGVREPLQVSSAAIVLTEQGVDISSFSAEFKDGPSVSGSAAFPLRCMSPESCVVSFDLHAPELAMADLNRLLNPARQNRPWYHLLSLGQRDDNALMKLRGRGRVSIARLSFGTLPLTNVTANLELKAGTASAKELKADVLGGQHLGNWDADFTASPPKFYGSGSFKKVAMAQVSAQMHDAWATGTLAGQYTIGLAGLNQAELASSATGSADFKWMNGSARRISLGGKAAPLSFSSFKGEIGLRNGSLSCQLCVLKASDAEYTVTGRAGLDRSLDLKLDRSGATAYTITGPLGEPNVQPVNSPSVEAKRR